MDEVSLTRLWIGRAIFLALCTVLLMLQLLPLETAPRRFAGPDLILTFAFAWVLRRPDYVPLLLVAAIFFTADLLLGRPPGLYAAMSILAFSHLRGRATALRDLPFTVEWLNVAMAVVFTMLAYRFILMLTFVDMPGFDLLLMRMAMTILCYPLVVLVTRYGFGVTKIGHGEVNALGQRQ